ncbi:hypothetical protein PMZ80_005194 [Knufia obscura]|uniref:Uncharacterized protein n=1 Tax=Knufia obscura TaxID=1635080 RepID=A0ABR0RPV1_9EURO|nr:hypothetical protein PMZ80_005194 [Knufia obscura]
MDSAHLRPMSSPPQFDAANSPLQNALCASSIASPDIFNPETSPSRQQRLLQQRNARFPAKKLSISSLSSKLTQLVGNNDHSDEAKPPSRNQENKLHKSRSTGTIGKKSSLSILDEISNTTRSRASRKRPEIPIYQDNPVRPLLQSSPYDGSSPHVDPQADFASPTSFDHIQDSLNMRLREVSLNERWSPLTMSPPPQKSKSRKRSLQITFDADEYIEHIEKELQQVRDEAYSPLTRRPLKEKLRVANKENERLQKELAMLKEKFEAEVKRTVEHKTVAESELKRRVRDLEDSLEEREQTLREMQYQHEEKRLDTNIIETLKASIERLEQEKLDMEEINLSMSKRNEVLTQLLAMSPTKTTNGFNLGSPVREKKNARPMSLILPRRPTSPRINDLSTASSIACSPLALASTDISPFKLTPGLNVEVSPTEEPEKTDGSPQPVADEQVYPPLPSPQLPDAAGLNRRWTMYSDISASSITANDEQKPTRRKARKFVAGSTQLKPLLLPTLTGEPISLPSSSVASSPRSWTVVDGMEADLDDTIIAKDLHKESPAPSATAPNEFDDIPTTTERFDDEGPGPGYTDSAQPTGGNKLVHECLADPERSSGDAQGLGFSMATHERSYTSDEDSSDFEEQFTAATTAARLNHVACNSLQTMPMPSTPDSLVALPRPLFSPMHRDTTVLTNNLQSRLMSKSPSASPEDPINLRKRRKRPLSGLDSGSPIAKVQRRQRRHSSSQDVPHTLDSPLLRTAADPDVQDHVLTHQVRRIRSSDNFAEVLRQRNFAAKPLAALTIRTVYKILATCTSAMRDFRRDPFALARKMLANAWYMNWKVLGKVSWWVLGLFLQPRATPKVRAPIDWDQYDGESIASRYSGSLSEGHGHEDDQYRHEDRTERTGFAESKPAEFGGPEEPDKPRWGHSLFLWGKFSATLMLAVGGAVIKGPGEMLKDVRPQERPQTGRHTRCQSCMAEVKKEPDLVGRRSGRRGARVYVHGRADTGFAREQIGAAPKDSFAADFDFRSDTQLDSSSFLDQIQQTGFDSTLRAEQPGRRRVDSLFTPSAKNLDTMSPCPSEVSQTPLALFEGEPHDFSDTHTTSMSTRLDDYQSRYT